MLALALALMGLWVSACADTSRRQGMRSDGDGDEAVANRPYDGDDGAVRLYGRAASTSVRRQVTALVERYYEAAAAGNWGRACALTYSLRAEAMTEEDTEILLPAYLQGAKTCSAAMSLLFAHMPNRPPRKVAVLSVRVDGRRGAALIGSRGAPLSVIAVKRELGRWKIDAPIGTPLP